jgi:hypothetical protein
MLSAFKRWRNQLLGREEAACSVPIFDGALKPNHELEDAPIFYQGQAAWDLCSDGEQLWLADGHTLVNLHPNGASHVVLQAQGVITAVCALAGGVAYAEQGRGVFVHGGAHDGRSWTQINAQALIHVNALSCAQDGLIATQGSQAFAPDQWQFDLMGKGQSAQVIHLPISDGPATVLRSNMAYAFGALHMNDEIWVSESWQHRLVALSSSSPQAQASREVLAQLPGYPSRMTKSAAGGAWLSVFACRTQLVEFVLRETAFRERMMHTMPPELWVAPQLRSGQSFLEPLQGGGIKQMGVLKPWAPPRSYGLVVRLNEQGVAVQSLHSRGGGRHHGVVALAECGDDLYVLSAGSHAVLRLSLRSLA